LKFYIIIPAHNEEENIGLTLESIAGQTVIPHQLIVVNDNSSDNTKMIVETFVQKYSWIRLINKQSTDKHLPGAKIIDAFKTGYEELDEHFDVICKFDADMIFESNYLEKIAQHFNANPKLGMAAGFCYIKKNNAWVLENFTQKDHIRGALKAYKKECFLQIGKLKSSIGWDTIDELLAQYYQWDILTDETLKVKHLKPTGQNYSAGAQLLQGVATYRMRLGLVLTLIIGFKMAIKKKTPLLFLDFIKGYFKAKKEEQTYLVDPKQGKFIRDLRWNGILKKIKLN